MPHFIADFAQEVTGITQNGNGPILDVSDYEHAGESMTCLSLIVTRTGGSTTVCAIALQVSLDGVNFAYVRYPTGIGDGVGDVLQINFLDVNGIASSCGFSGFPFCYARYVVALIGANNEITIQLLAGRA